MRAQFKLIATKSMLVILAVTGIFGVISFVIGEFDDWQWKTLGSLFLLVSLCIGVLCNSLLFDTRYKTAGVAGAVLSFLSTVSTLVLLWWDYKAMNDSGFLDFLVRFAGITVTLSFASVVISLLLHFTRQKTSAITKMLWTTIGLVLGCAAIVSLAIIEEDVLNDDLIVRLLGVMSILATVGAIATPIIGKITKEKTVEPANPESVTELPSVD